MTITIATDAELMTNVVSANSVPAANRFFAFVDEQKNPAVLSHGDNGKLNLIIHVDGRPQLCDLGAVWRLRGTVQQLSLSQSADMKVSVAVATDAGNSQSFFYLIRDLFPSQLRSFSSDNIVQAGDLFPEIHGIHTSGFTYDVGGVGFPMVFLALQPWDRITKEDQLAIVDVTVGDDGKEAVSLNKTWGLATDALKILAVEFGTCRLGNAAFVLYETVGGLKLQLRTIGGASFSAELAAPPGASCLASYVDPDSNSSVFLVGGDNVTQYTFKDYVNPSSTGKALAVDFPSGLKDLHTARDGDQVTLWFTTSSDAAYYYAAPTTSLDGGTLVQLLREGRGGRMSSLLHSEKSSNGQTVLVKTVVSVDEAGDLTLLQQASDTGMWEGLPVYVTADGENMDVDCYTVRIRAMTDVANDPNQCTAGCSLYLTASGYVRVLRNGRVAVLGQDGGWFDADKTGTVTLIVPTADMSCHTIAVGKIRAPNGNVTNLDVPIIDPGAKSTARLAASVKTGDDLLNAKTQTGKPLIPPGSVSTQDAGKAAAMIQQLSGMQQSMRSVERPGPKEFSSGGGSPWDFFRMLLDDAENVASWFLKTAGNAVHFVCEWAGKTYEFILDTISAVGKALSWVFAKIKVAIKDIIDFVGFLFDWGSILTYADSIAAFFNAGLDYGIGVVDELKEGADAFLEELRSKLEGRRQPGSLPINGTAASPMPNGAVPSNITDAQHGVGCNWSAYQLQHGGFVETLSNPNPAAGNRGRGEDTEDAFTDPSPDVFNDVVQEVQTVAELVQDMGNAFTSLFNGKSGTEAFFNQITDAAVDALCDTLENLVDAFIGSIEYLIGTLKEVADHVIDISIPCFKALWRAISGGRDFTLLNCVALIIAIPASIMHKLLVKRSDPPKLKGKMDKAVFQSYVQGGIGRAAAAATTRGENQDLAYDIFITVHITAAALVIVSLEVGAIAYAMDAVADIPGGCDISPKFGNTVDCFVLNFSAVGLILSWPPKSQFDQPYRWTIWCLQLSDAAMLTFMRIFGFQTGTPRAETAMVSGTWNVLTGIGIYVLQLTVAADEWARPDSDPAKDNTKTTADVVGDTFGLVSTVAFEVASLTAQEAPLASKTALGAGVVCKLAEWGCKGWVVWLELQKRGW